MADVSCLMFDDDDTLYEIEDNYARAGLNEIVNVYSAKNLFRQNVDIQSTVGGYTVTKVANGGIRVAGTDNSQQTIPIMDNFTLKSNVKYRLNGCPAGGLAGGYSLQYNNGSGTAFDDTGSGVEFYAPSSQTSNVIWIAVNGTVDVTFYPQLALARFNSAYDEPVLTNEELQSAVEQIDADDVTWDDLSKVGAVNMLPNNATTQTTNGITFTVNEDGTITANGTATANAYCYIYDCDGNEPFVGKKVKLSGCPSGGGADKYKIVAFRALSQDGSTGSPEDTGNSYTFTWRNNGSGTKARVYITIYSGQTVNNLVFKPMITIPTYNGEYAPYVMTNEHITNLLNNSYVFIGSDDTSITTTNAEKAVKNKIKELSDAITTYRNALNDDEFFEITGLYVGSYNFTKMNEVGKLFSKTDGLTDTLGAFIGTSISLNTTTIRGVQLHNGVNSCHLNEIIIAMSDGTITTSQKDNDTTTDIYRLRILKYKKIS